MHNHDSGVAERLSIVLKPRPIAIVPLPAEGRGQERGTKPLQSPFAPPLAHARPSSLFPFPPREGDRG